MINLLRSPTVRIAYLFLHGLNSLLLAAQPAAAPQASPIDNR